MDIVVNVLELQEGDRVDLESCPYLHSHPSAEFEYAIVDSIERENPECVLVWYQDVPCCGYPTTQTLTIRKRKN